MDLFCGPLVRSIYFKKTVTVHVLRKVHSKSGLVPKKKKHAYDVAVKSYHRAVFHVYPKVFSHLILFECELNSHSPDVHRMQIESTSITFTLPKF